MFDLITIGDATIDAFHMLEDKEFDLACSLQTDVCRLCMTYADKIPVKEVHRLVAGNAANNAVGASRLGLRTALYTVIGDDDSGARIKAQLKAEGVVDDYILTEAGTSSNYSTVLSFRGERTILVHHVARQYRLPRMQSTKWVYLTSMAEGSEMIFSELLSYLATHKAKLIFQPGTFQLRLGRESAAELLKRTEMIIMNVEEAEEYLGVPPKTDIHELLSGLAALGPKITIITDGRKGSYAKYGSQAWFLAARPEIPRIESTGAGDAYATGFAAALMQGKDIPESMQWGTLNSEGVIQQIGPQAGLLALEAMETKLQQATNLKPVTI